MVTSEEGQIDELLAAVLRGEAVRWPDADFAPDAVVERIVYHGIAGLVADRARDLADWPERVIGPVREQAVAMAMWELRHTSVLRELLAALAAASVETLLLKGSALAYDLYPTPATRARGDSDLLVDPAALETARSVFVRLGYRRQPLDAGIADDLALQEVWSLTCPAGTGHYIDLHWQLLNAPALRDLFPFDACKRDPLPLPRLGPHAGAMNRPLTLLHTCVHRAMHLTSPYFVNGVTYYGGDRLIWAMDIDLLSGALSECDWRAFNDAALDQGVATVCLDGLNLARRTLGTAIPSDVTASLGIARDERASAYLLGSGQARRAWADLSAITGIGRKLAYVGARGLPSAAFMRCKYPEFANRPLAMLHLRRMIDLIRPRPDTSRRG